MNVIFLDVDGELTYSDYQNSETANIDVEKVKLLKMICDATDAKVVISSSWRGTPNHTPQIYYKLLSILADNDIEVLGATPFIPVESEGTVKQPFSLEDVEGCRVKHETGRAAEIELWLEHHDVSNFVILDDEDWAWEDYGFEQHWIRPTWYCDGGLKQEHVEEAIAILQNTKIMEK